MAQEVEIKLERAPLKPAKAEGIELGKNLDAAAGFRSIGLSCLRQILLNQEPLQRGDGEALHQMRVGLRRLRAAISIFKSILGDPETEAIKAQLRWLTEQLGPARDYDVLVAESIVPLQASDTHCAELERLETWVRDQHAHTLAQAQRAVASPRFREIGLDTALWLFGGAWAHAPGQRRLRRRALASLARAALAKRTHKLHKTLARLEGLDQGQRHRLRIAVKKLHYGTEFFSSLFPSHAARRRRFVKVLKTLQDCLGKLNDIRIHADIAREIVHPPDGVSARAPGREEAFAIGLLRGAEQAEAHQLVRTAVKARARLKQGSAFYATPR